VEVQLQTHVVIAPRVGKDSNGALSGSGLAAAVCGVCGGWGIGHQWVEAPLLGGSGQQQAARQSTRRIWRTTSNPAKEEVHVWKAISRPLSTSQCAPSLLHTLIRLSKLAMALDVKRLNSKLDFQNQDYWLHIQADTKLDKYPGERSFAIATSCQRSDIGFSQATCSSCCHEVRCFFRSAIARW
jgi:hypothetical protein